MTKVSSLVSFYFIVIIRLITIVTSSQPIIIASNKNRRNNYNIRCISIRAPYQTENIHLSYNKRANSFNAEEDAYDLK